VTEQFLGTTSTQYSVTMQWHTNKSFIECIDLSISFYPSSTDLHPQYGQFND